MSNSDKGFDLTSEKGQIQSVNSVKKKAFKGFAKESVAGSVRILDSVSTESTPETEASKEDAKPAEQPVAKDSVDQPSNNGLSADQLKQILELAVTNAVNPLQQQLKELAEQNVELRQTVEKTSGELESTKQQLEQTQKDSKTLEDLGKLIGKSVEMPMVNQRVSSKSDKPDGILKDFFAIQDRVPKVVKMNSKGQRIITSDPIALDNFVRENKQQIIKDLESYAKANGFLQGSTTRVTDAATVAADLPGGFLDVLSSLMRTNNRPGFVYWQFPTTRIEFNKGEGDTIKIPRAAYQPAPADPDDRLLSGNGAFYNIDSSSQNIATGVVSCLLKEWGLGKNSTYPPIGIPSFVSAYSMIDLMMILERNLMYDYYQWEDLKIRSLWDATSRVVYNEKGEITTTSSNVASGDDGTMTEKFLNSLYAYMRRLLIPTYMNGCYGIVMHSKAVAQLKNSLGAKFYFPADSNIQELTNILNPTVIGSGEVDKVTGYVGKYCGFMVFETNAHSLGASGTEGVQTETVNSTSTITRTSYAFGSDTIGRGIGTPMEIRKDIDTNFGRLDRWVWTEHSGFSSLDVDPTGYNDTSDVPQQLRVIDVRTIDVAV